MSINEGHNRWIRLGVFFLVFGFSLFIAWLALAPIQSAAIAPGSIEVEGSRKKIQHLEGGIVDNIYIDEGSLVNKGQLLVQLKNTKYEANYQQLYSQYANALAKYNRLQAEVNSYSNVNFSSELNSKNETSVQAMQNQYRLFLSRKESLLGRIDVAKKKEYQAQKNLESYLSRVKSDRQSLKVVEEQLNMVSSLLKKGYVSKSRQLELQAQQISILKKLGDFDSETARAELQISEAAQQVANIKLDFLKDASQELESLDIKILQLKAALQDAKDMLERTSIYSPIEGTVVNLSLHTKGGVINPGEVLMEIVPQKATLIVEALVSTSDIDVVTQGLEAEIRLTSYNYRRVLPIHGKVVNVSADRIDDKTTRTSAYSIRVELDQESISKNKNIKLYPGMPAEVMILLGERTTLEYLLNPIFASFNKSFRETD
ncbi:HlyD family type I secretion periplasmic adaptor subunit [uncultured Amphritea sp.]|uniref:HlyD family type I secretion periplasmic adaptor subunit n=1 Tax=uncultured Amphritea sp. TaxID=981605 RepID=UPI002626BA05|nr:HlyD family type I secretion periplasmic adaptor subunit [uncultured Amphritea sp.]